MNYGMVLAATAVMALVTYLPRMLPMAVIKRKIQNRFIRSFLFLQDRICTDAKINRNREWSKLHKTSGERMCNLPEFPENGRDRAKTAVPGNRMPKHSA